MELEISEQHKPIESFVAAEQPDPRLDGSYTVADAVEAGTPTGDELSDKTPAQEVSPPIPGPSESAEPDNETPASPEGAAKPARDKAAGADIEGAPSRPEAEVPRSAADIDNSHEDPGEEHHAQDDSAGDGEDGRAAPAEEQADKSAVGHDAGLPPPPEGPDLPSSPEPDEPEDGDRLEDGMNLSSWSLIKDQLAGVTIENDITVRGLPEDESERRDACRPLIDQIQSEVRGLIEAADEAVIAADPTKLGDKRWMTAKFKDTPSKDELCQRVIDRAINPDAPRPDDTVMRVTSYPEQPRVVVPRDTSPKAMSEPRKLFGKIPAGMRQTQQPSNELFPDHAYIAGWPREYNTNAYHDPRAVLPERVGRGIHAAASLNPQVVTRSEINIPANVVPSYSNGVRYTIYAAVQPSEDGQTVETIYVPVRVDPNQNNSDYVPTRYVPTEPELRALTGALHAARRLHAGQAPREAI